MGDKKKALNYYMLALPLPWSMEQGILDQAGYCLDGANKADPEDMGLRHLRASYFVDLGDHQKAAGSYHQIWQLRPKNLEALKKAATNAVSTFNILEDHIKKKPKDSDADVVRLLASLLMSESAHEKALQYIQTCSASKELPVDLLVKAGICHVHLGNFETAEEYFSVLNVNDCGDLVVEVADSLMSVKNHESALKYYLMLEGSAGGDKKGLLNLNIGRCYQFLSARAQAIDYLYKALEELHNDIDARLDLVSLLLEEDKEDEAISVLSPPPPDSESRTSDRRKPWWTEGKIKLELSYIYRSKGFTKAFVETILPLVRETLFQRKARIKKRLPKGVLYKRLQVLDEHQTGNVFHGFHPIASSSDLSKAARAKKLLQKRETKREEKRAAALAAGIEWQSDELDDESPLVAESWWLKAGGWKLAAYREPPLPNILKDDDQLTLIVDFCKGLVSVKKYSEALEIITSILKLAQNTLSVEK
ncbi:putative tetratricopeptide-like helical domain superfamily [Helianthus anomalus]